MDTCLHISDKPREVEDNADLRREKSFIVIRFGLSGDQGNITTCIGTDRLEEGVDGVEETITGPIEWW